LLETSYELVTNGPAAMHWGDYEAVITRDWQALLSSGACGDERVFQTFLERHPCLVPGPFGLFGTSGHAPYPAAVISQPVLPDFTRKTPDFMWIAKSSSAICPVLIEIEAPSKRWFTKEGRPRAELTQALDQLTEWKTWFAEPLNAAQFCKYYRIFDDFRPYILIYGRESEPNSSRNRIQKRVHLSRPDEFLMTFDRLRPEPKASDFLCARIDAEGYRAITVPPTIHLGPVLANDPAQIRGKKKATHASPHLSDERRAFLVQRFDYWDRWSRERRGRIIRVTDTE
jgi:hypothetical protein